MIRSLISLLLVFSLSLSSFAQSYDLSNVENQVPFRTQDRLYSEGVYLTPYDEVITTIERQEGDERVRYEFSSRQMNQATGLPLGNLDHLDKSLPKLLSSEANLSKLKDSYIFITGLSKKAREKNIQAVKDKFKNHGIDIDAYNIKFKYMHLPYHMMKEGADNIFKKVWSRTSDVLLSMNKDYVRPLNSEFAAAALATAAIEIPLGIYLFNTMPTLDATVTFSLHGMILMAYSRWSMTIGNWVTRQGSAKGFMAFYEKYNKQIMLSLPFLANFTVFTNTSKHYEAWTNYAAQSTAAVPGLDAVLSIGLDAAGSTPGVMYELLTQIAPHIQTIFYTAVMASGFYVWRAVQKGIKSDAARTAMHLFTFPVLALDSFLFFKLHDVNDPYRAGWIAGLLGLTLAGGMLFYPPESIKEYIVKWNQKRKVKKKKKQSQELTVQEEALLNEELHLKLRTPLLDNLLERYIDFTQRESVQKFTKAFSAIKNNSKIYIYQKIGKPMKRQVITENSGKTCHGTFSN